MSDLDEIKNELKNQGKAIDKMETFMGEVSDALQKLAALQAHHEEQSDAVRRSFKIIEEHSVKIWNIEQKLPAFTIARNVIFGLVGMILMGVMGAVIGMVVIS